MNIIQSRPRRFKKEERGFLGKSWQEGGKLNIDET
jgi:hypothetical protein